MMRKLFGGGAPAPAPAPAQVPTQDASPIQDANTDNNTKPITKSNTPNNSSNNLPELEKEENNDKKIDNEMNKNSITSTPPKEDATGTSYSTRMGRFFGMGKKDTTSSPSDPTKDTKDTKEVNQLTAGGGVGSPDKSTADKSTTDKSTTDKATTDKATTDKPNPDNSVDKTTAEIDKKDPTLTAGGGSSKDNSKPGSKSTTPNISSNNLVELDKSNTVTDKTSTEEGTNIEKTPKDKINSKSSTPNTNSSNTSGSRSDKKKLLTPIKENDKKDDENDDNNVTSEASLSSSKPLAGDILKDSDDKKESNDGEADNGKATDLRPDSESKIDNVSSDPVDQSQVPTITTTDKDKASVTKDLSKELNEVAKEKEQPQKPTKPAKNEITVVKGDVIDIQNVDKAMEVICNELLRFQGSINAVHDKAIPIFTSFDQQVNGSLTGKVSSSEFAQVIAVLTDEKGQEKVFADSCVTVYNNFCDADNMLDYNSWLASMVTSPLLLLSFLLIITIIRDLKEATKNFIVP